MAGNKVVQVAVKQSQNRHEKYFESLSLQAGVLTTLNTMSRMRWILTGTKATKRGERSLMTNQIDKVTVSVGLGHWLVGACNGHG